jgi:erythromycin esterase-like protein
VLAELAGRGWDDEEGFAAVLAAQGVVDAVAWARVVLTRHTSAWNVRDTHMADVVDAVRARLAVAGAHPRVVIWAHNSHVGDARPSAFGRMGEVSLGQLLRQRHGHDRVRLVGALTYQGTVTAARDWGLDPHRMALRPAPPDSWEALLHAIGEPRFRVDLRHVGPTGDRAERAVGVVYLPHRERTAHLFPSRISERFDHLLYYDTTRALIPLDPWGAVAEEDLPETWPFAL